jgi:hypothetical protein
MAHEEYDANCMMGKPITELGKLIGANWFRPFADLSKETTVPVKWITQAVHGGKIPQRYEEMLTRYLLSL